MIKNVKQVVTGSAAVDGAGVKLVRVLGNQTAYDFDPFLMLDAFDSTNPRDYTKGFPWHPHRGIETITYLIEGDIEHQDNLGNKGSILAGCCQWMTAGSGILHQEMPKEAPQMLGVQLWLNLPRKDKMTKPQYCDIQASMITKVEEKGTTVRVISGNYHDVEGAVQGDFVKTLFLDVTMEPHQEWSYQINPELNAFTYIVVGDGYFEKENQTHQHAKSGLLFDAGDEIYAKSGNQGIRFLLLAAKPLKEPIAWGGPIVMNTKEELYQAFDELDKGTFIKKI